MTLEQALVSGESPGIAAAKYSSLSFSSEYFSALVSWIRARGLLSLLAAALAAAPVTALLQGAYFLARYRIESGGAPVPHVPSHGVVVSLTYRRNECDVVVATDPGGGGLDPERDPTPRSSRGGSATVPTRLPPLRRKPRKRPLRLLMIGYSLATGVGVSRSSAPVLPESIARSLSAALGGRAVFWTCVAEPG